MNTTEITRQFAIDMGHRLRKHESKCRNAHGHRYTIEVTVTSSELDEVGRVIDFGAIKERVGDWLDDVFDHGFVVEQGDPLADWLAANQQKHLVVPFSPTIEHLVRHWFAGAQQILTPLGVRVTKVKAFETPFCWAEYTGG
jgi:6-pyruvoyltetrahydropterin/6-carboxytetrahydropterin synthase